MKYLFLVFCLVYGRISFAQERSQRSMMSEAETRVNPKSAAYDPVIAFSLYRKTAAMGNPIAMNALGVMYSQGLGTSVDTTQAVDWFKKSANAGYSNALFNLGQIYREGIGVAQNFLTAFQYFHSASEKKSPAGYYEEGYMLYKGLGCPQDYNGAFRLFMAAIPMGSISSMYMAALCYRNGYGTNVNLDSARIWLKVAADRGYQAASEEMTIPTPENPDLGVQETKAPKSLTLKQSRLKNALIQKDDIAGEYSGYIVRYDWSGQHVIGKAPLKLSLRRVDNVMTGTWKEEGLPGIPLSAKLTDTSLVFDNTSYEKTDHYNLVKPSRFEFRNALLQIERVKDSVLLSGNIQLWSTTLREPEKPIFISLSRDNENPDFVRNIDHASQDSIVTGFLAFPNPFSNSFQVQFTTHSSTIATITLTDVLTGKQVYLHTTNALSVGKQSVGVSANINPGTYILRLLHDKYVKALLVIKQ